MPQARSHESPSLRPPLNGKGGSHVVLALLAAAAMALTACGKAPCEEYADAICACPDHDEVVCANARQHAAAAENESTRLSWQSCQTALTFFRCYAQKKENP
ncbi:MAG: hypothetical protein GMKNLPBB_01292 [Myxococcota bacterium]|nr:hypothetical protein [Myxococcota bacterium]